MRLKLLATLLWAALAATQSLAATPINGFAHVHDGDTIRIGRTSVRIWGIDAVELKQNCRLGDASVPCGEMARDALLRIIDGQEVTCFPKGKSYSRIVGTCYVAGRDVADEMIRLGMAYDYARYSHGYYSGSENQARQTSLGLWAMETQNPAVWRACHLRAKDKRPAAC